MVELKVVLCEPDLPGSGVGSDFMGLGPIGKVLVIGPDDDR